MSEDEQLDYYEVERRRAAHERRVQQLERKLERLQRDLRDTEIQLEQERELVGAEVAKMTRRTGWARFFGDTA
jgi:hypothetical protein